jgi:hypothetical protein
MTEIKPMEVTSPHRANTEEKLIRAVGGTSFVLALLQSLCVAVLTVSGIRVAIGLTALAAASGIFAPARGFHQDAIRIPMLWVATIGALVNLGVIAWIRHLRARPAAQWRRRELSGKQKRSERLQIVLAFATLFLVGLEVWTHSMVHRAKPAQAATHQRLAGPRYSPESRFDCAGMPKEVALA